MQEHNGQNIQATEEGLEGDNSKLSLRVLVQPTCKSATSTCILMLASEHKTITVLTRLDSNHRIANGEETLAL